MKGTFWSAPLYFIVNPDNKGLPFVHTSSVLFKIGIDLVAGPGPVVFVLRRLGECTRQGTHDGPIRYSLFR